MSEKKLIVPCIHMNGTGENALRVVMENAYTELGEAEEALHECAPNGRDYYPYSPQAYERARSEWRHRMLLIQQVRTELDELIGGIDERHQEVVCEDLLKGS